MLSIPRGPPAIVLGPHLYSLSNHGAFHRYSAAISRLFIYCDTSTGIANVNAYQTDSPDRYRWPNISARLQNLRNLLSSERHLGADQRRAFEAIDREMDQMAADRLAARERRRRGDPETHIQDRDAHSVSESPPQSATSASLVRARRRAVRPSERLQRYQRERIGQSGRAATSDTFVSPSELSPASPAQTSRGDRLRPKRRKLDDGSYEENNQTFSYGHLGQVIPGQLRMEVASCDGGEYSDPHVPVNSYPQNVLRDDNTVYCTKNNRCNLVLKHVGGMPFSLTQIVVKAPATGYDCPIQEGMVFVAMDDEKLLDNTSRYEIRWSPKAYRHYPGRAEGVSLSEEYFQLARAAHDPIDRSLFLNNPANEEEAEGQEDNDDDLGVSLVPGFTVSVADRSDEEDVRRSQSPIPPWQDEEYSLRAYVDRPRPVYLASERNDGLWSSSSDSEGYEPEAEPLDDRERHRRQVLETESNLAQRNRLLDLMRAQQIRDNDEVFGRRGHQEGRDDEIGLHNRRSTPSRIELRSFTPTGGAPNPPDRSEEHPSTSMGSGEPTSKHFVSQAGGSSSSRSDVIPPHARFFINRTNCSTTIKFDPPISGRFILIKLWAQCPSANIDVQAILAYGYGGPRFFPSTGFR
ncbi:hypothetical protein A1O1_04432 [Capronia coronata CBS 617.96]|uniref:Uncharacterized protein n=1 Tax=Capronia coronata CBS 617.96 TaxID=1182541 RepID=W9YNR3_9EURO|nr:uncharacterized protein A1O1_04432 [Capronia coronata CBS 617.96]EXJ91320.1 hypothetical protein A1O1_04432 [Capronia coronata CBS 617.96]